MDKHPWLKFIPPLAWVFVGATGEAMFGFLGPLPAAVGFALSLNLLLFYFLWSKYPKDIYKKYGGLSAGIIVALIFIWIVPPLLSGPKIDKNKIQVGLQYAYAWGNYKDSKNTSNPEDWWRVVDEPIVRKYSQEKMRLLLGVQNANGRISIKNIWLHVAFVTGNLSIETDKLWVPLSINKHYYVILGNINPNAAIAPDGNLFVKFPGPGTYKISCTINGDTFGNVTRSFEIILK